MFQRRAFQDPEHPNFKRLIAEEGEETRVIGKRYPTNPAGKNDPLLKSTAKLSNLCVEEIFALEKWNQVYEKFEVLGPLKWDFTRENRPKSVKFWDIWLRMARNPPLVRRRFRRRGGFLARVGTDADFFLRSDFRPRKKNEIILR